MIRNWCWGGPLALVLGCLSVSCAPSRERVELSQRLVSAEEVSLRKTPAIQREQGAPSRSKVDSVVVVMLDGVRWQDIYSGASGALLQTSKRARERYLHGDLVTPELHQLARQGLLLGSAGSALFASGPNFISLPGYTEFFTGQPAVCQRNDCPPLKSITLFDELQKNEPNAESAVFASWQGIGKVASSQGAPWLMSTGRSISQNHYLAEDIENTNALLLSRRAGNPWPGSGDYRPDVDTISVAEAYLGERRPRLLFVGLGDPDEHAHHGDYVAYLDSLVQADAFIGWVGRRMQDWLRAGYTSRLIVTTDHGRSDNFRDHGSVSPESARIWALIYDAGRSRLLSGSGYRGKLSDLSEVVRASLGNERAMLSPLMAMLRLREDKSRRPLPSGLDNASADLSP